MHESDIETLFTAGITKGCSTSPPLYCLDQDITRGQIAAFINRALGLPATEADFFVDDNGTYFEPDINAVTAAGIGFGCGASEYCPDRVLAREEMAELLVRAFQIPTTVQFYFPDDDTSAYESSINALYEAGVTLGCSADPLLYCPGSPVTRAQMASFFVRAMGR